MDSKREARVRRMVPDPTTWPGAYLCMKRYENDRIVEFGAIFGFTDTGGIAMYVDNVPEKRVAVFPHVDDLIAAGWAVD